MRIAGLVLAGGRSSRFGSEKAAAVLDGRPLVAHVADALAAGCEALAVNAPPDREAAAWARAGGVALLSDPPGAPDGPLSGMLQGVRWAAARGCDALATAPCDVPRLPFDLVARLAAALGEAPAAVARTSDGVQPLCALWRVSLAGPMAQALTQGHPSVRRWLAEIGAVEVAFADADAFANVNTPADLPAKADNAPRIAP